jgi:hypothetical protein
MMKKAEVVPNVIGGEKVLYFIRIETKHTLTGNTKQIVNGKLIGPVYGLAICKSDNPEGYYLFGCDENWKSITDTFHESIEDAMDQGEFEYKGTFNDWKISRSINPD